MDMRVSKGLWASFAVRSAWLQQLYHFTYRLISSQWVSAPLGYHAVLVVKCEGDHLTEASLIATSTIIEPDDLDTSY
jgi:hypothetical protein